MLSSILILILILGMLGGIGFFPAPAFTPAARGMVGAMVFAVALVWLFRYSHLL